MGTGVQVMAFLMENLEQKLMKQIKYYISRLRVTASDSYSFSILYIAIWAVIAVGLYIAENIIPFSEYSFYSFFPDLFLFYAIMIWGL